MDRQAISEIVRSEMGGCLLGEITMKPFVEVLNTYLKQGNTGNKPISRKRDEASALPLKQFFKGKFLADERVKGMITPYHVDQYRNWRLQTVTKETVARDIALANKALNWWRKKKWVMFLNPFEGMQYVEGKTHRDRVLSDTEIQSLLTHSDGLLRDLIMFYLQTGFRAKEALTLRKDHISGHIARLRPEDNKSGKWAERYLDDFALGILDRQPIHEYAFSKDGEPVSYWWLRNQWRKLRVKCDMPDIRIHDLRRTCGDIVNSLYGIQAAKELLGHSTISTTEAVYTPDKLAIIKNCVASKEKRPTGDGGADKSLNGMPKSRLELETSALRKHCNLH